MAYSHRLHNPTPFDANIKWDRGVVITVGADSSTTLTTQQMEDFLPGKPGHEEVRKVLDSYGLFLEDSDREYDSQALEAIKNCIQYKNQRYTEAVTRLQELHTMQGIEADSNAPAFRQKLQAMGLERLKTEIEILQKRAEKYRQVIGPEDDDFGGAKVAKYDPERTIFVTDPPREFKSKTQMEIFLEENPEVKELHEEDIARRASLVAQKAMRKEEDDGSVSNA